MESIFWFFEKIFAMRLFLDCRFVESFWWFWWKINLLSMQFLCRWIGVERLNVSGFNNSWTNVWVVDISNMSNDLHLVHMVYHLARFIPAVIINIAASCLKGLRVNVMMPWVAAFNSTPISCKNNKTSCNSPRCCVSTNNSHYLLTWLHNFVFRLQPVVNNQATDDSGQCFFHYREFVSISAKKEEDERASNEVVVDRWSPSSRHEWRAIKALLLGDIFTWM